jgi:integrase
VVRRATNPFANTRLPQSRGRKDLIVLTEAEVYELADLALEIHPGPLGQVVRGMILFAAGTGIRPAELWAVERDHLRLDDAECDIRQTVKADGKIRPLTKNYRIRTVIVPPMAAEGATCFPPRLDVRQLFFTPRARQFTRSQHDRYWAAVRKAWVAKLPADHHLRRRQDIDLEDNLAFYELRHFCATDMLERGATPEDVAVQLGHQDGGRLVRELYGHPDDANARGRLKQLYARKVTPIRAATGSQAAEGSRS